MKPTFLFIYFIILLTPNASRAQEKEADLLKQIDNLIAGGEEYAQQREQRINRLKTQLKVESLPEKQFELTNSIIEEYKSYQSDSAFTYVDKNLELAKVHKNMDWLIQTQLQYSFILSSSGLFEECSQLMEHISADQLTEYTQAVYYKQLLRLYLNINIYQRELRFTQKYESLIQSSYDSIIANLPKESQEILYYKALKAQADKDYEQAADFLGKYLEQLQPGTHQYAMKSYNYYLIKVDQQEEDKYIKYLMMAVISDIQDAIKENNAMSDLAIWLFNKGDTDRAYRYIKYSLEDANFYNARFRYFKISKALPIIAKAYEEKSKQESNHLKLTLIAISLLLIALIITCILLLKQATALRQTKKEMKASNQVLEQMNQQLSSLNRDLAEANQVKEEYIGYFLDLCSEYIGKLDDYRKLIHNWLAAKRYDELLKITTSSRGNSATETKELYTNFDKAFLSIYAGFVPAFNKLLKEEEQFEVKKDELNTELRVFALIRMGISDSTRIAIFLRCSVQTVYNYRSKIKRKCKEENDDIEELIKKIGTIK